MEQKAKGRAADGRIGVSLAKDTAERLSQVRSEVSDTLGIDLSLTQTVDYLVMQYNKRKKD